MPDEPVARDDVIGRARLVVPFAGLPAVWADGGRWELLGAWVALTLIVARAGLGSWVTSLRPPTGGSGGRRAGPQITRRRTNDRARRPGFQAMLSRRRSRRRRGATVATLGMVVLVAGSVTVSADRALAAFSGSTAADATLAARCRCIPPTSTLRTVPDRWATGVSGIRSSTPSCWTTTSRRSTAGHRSETVRSRPRHRRRGAEPARCARPPTTTPTAGPPRCPAPSATTGGCRPGCTAPTRGPGAPRTGSPSRTPPVTATGSGRSTTARTGSRSSAARTRTGATFGHHELRGPEERVVPARARSRGDLDHRVRVRRRGHAVGHGVRHRRRPLDLRHRGGARRPGLLPGRPRGHHLATDLRRPDRRGPGGRRRNITDDVHRAPRRRPRPGDRPRRRQPPGCALPRHARRSVPARTVNAWVDPTATVGRVRACGPRATPPRASCSTATERRCGVERGRPGGRTTWS